MEKEVQMLFEELLERVDGDFERLTEAYCLPSDATPEEIVEQALYWGDIDPDTMELT